MRLSDLFLQSAKAIFKQKRRNAFSAFGIAWGVASVLILAGWGTGLEKMMKEGMNSLGDNIIFVFAGHTSTGVGGYRAGRTILLYPEDIDVIKAHSSLLKFVLPEDDYTLNVARGSKSEDHTVRAVVPDAKTLRNLRAERGRFFTPDDIASRRRVCFIGQKIRDEFFEKSEDAVGQELRIGGVRFTVVGVLFDKKQMANIGTRDESVVFVPFSTGRSLFAGGHQPVAFIEGRAFDPDQSEQAATEIRKAMAAKYHFSPDDQEALFILPMTRFTDMIDKFAAAIAIFVAAVGAVTLAIGGIGVTNMMLVSVSERVGEIGIRRATGGRRRWIILQFLTETFMISMIAGAIGLSVGLAVLLGVSKLPLPEEVPLPILSRDVTIFAVVVMVATGLVAGITPARKAANIPPVEAIKGDLKMFAGSARRRRTSSLLPGLFGEIISEAIEDMRASKLRAILTAFGVFWGVAAVSLLLGWGTGMQEKMVENLEQLGGRRTVVYPRRIENPISGLKRAKYVRFTEQDVTNLRTNAWFIERFTPEIDMNFPVTEYAGQSRAINTLGVLPDVKVVRNFELAQGRFINQRDVDERRKVAVLGAGSKEKLFGPADALGKTIRIKGKPFLVVGVAVKKGEQTSIENSLDDDKILIPYTTAKTLTGIRNPHYFQLHPSLALGYKDIETRLRKILLGARGVTQEDALSIYSYLEAQEETKKGIRGLGMFLGGVGLITLVIGAVGVANVMFVSVAQRTREIGVRRAIGAKRSHIFLQFVSEAILICFVGGVGGVLIAFLISLVMGSLSLPQFFAAPKMTLGLLALVFGFIVGTGIISGVFPAKKASDSNVIESLHYE